MWSFESIVRLGWSFVRTLVRGIFTRDRELPRFVAQYRPDGMLTREPGDHLTVVSAGRCIGCGACDVVAIERGLADALGPRGPMAYVQGVSRQAGIDDPVDAMASPALLAALTDACPVGVPFVALVTLVRRRHRELAEARAMPEFSESIVPPLNSAG